MSRTKSYNVAIVGATGAVGEVMLEILEEREFPVEEIFLLASERSEGKRLSLEGKMFGWRGWINSTFQGLRSVCFLQEDRCLASLLPGLQSRAV